VDRHVLRPGVEIGRPEQMGQSLASNVPTGLLTVVDGPILPN